MRKPPATPGRQWPMKYIIGEWQTPWQTSLARVNWNRPTPSSSAAAVQRDFAMPSMSMTPPCKRSNCSPAIPAAKASQTAK